MIRPGDAGEFRQTDPAPVAKGPGFPRKTGAFPDPPPSAVAAGPAAPPSRTDEDATEARPALESLASALSPIPGGKAQTVLLAVLTALAVLYTLYAARAILLPIVLAVVLSFVLRPVVRALRGHGIPPFIGSALILALLLLTLVFGVTRLIVPAREWIAAAPEMLNRVEERVRAFGGTIVGLEETSRRIEKIADGGDEGDDAVPVRVQGAGLSDILLNMTGAFLAGAFVAVVTLFFLLALGDRLVDKIVSLLTDWRGKRSVRELVDELEQGISRYLFTITTVNAFLGTAIGTALWAIGLPNPVLWGVMAGFLNFIPYLGAAVGSTVVFIVALATFDTTWPIVLAPLAYFSINALEGNFLTPMIVGRSMSLNPLLVVLSLTFWGWLWGVGGALLAVPMLAVAKIVCDHFPKLSGAGVLLGR